MGDRPGLVGCGQQGHFSDTGTLSGNLLNLQVLAETLSRFPVETRQRPWVLSGDRRETMATWEPASVIPPPEMAE